MLNADASSPVRPSVPNVVIGVSPSPSSVGEIASSKSDAAVQLELPVTPSTPPVAVAAAAVAPVRDTLIAPAMPEESDDEEDDEEPASEERIRVAEKVEEPKAEEPPAVEAKVEAKVEPKEEPKAEEPPVNLHDTLIDAQKIQIVKPVTEPRHDDTLVDAQPPSALAVLASADAKPNFEKTLPFGSADDFVAKKEEPKPLPAVQVMQEEETIPPAGDLAVVEPVAEQFFSEGDISRHASADDDLDSIVNEKAQRKSDPAVVQRRAKLAKYVTWAVGVSAALCLIAVVRTTFSSSSKTITSANAASVKTEMAVKAPPPPPVAPAVKAAEPAAAAIAAPVEPVKAVITGDVKEEKAKVKAALDKNKLADAIEAGERAVAIEETDSEAWLLLGAAYHAKGQLKDAQRAYHSCVEKGTKDKFQRECKLFAR
jgi:hypothetical protein